MNPGRKTAPILSEDFFIFLWSSPEFWMKNRSNRWSTFGFRCYKQTVVVYWQMRDPDLKIEKVADLDLFLLDPERFRIFKFGDPATSAAQYKSHAVDLLDCDVVRIF